MAMVSLYITAKNMLMPIFRFMYKPELVGTENIPLNGGVILAGNHMHAFDPALVAASTKREVCILAKKELHDGKLGFFFRAAGTIPVDLHASSNPEALNAALEKLRSGGVIGLSPEAKRNYTKRLLLPFKFGAAVMSVRTGCPIIPYSITGSYKWRGRLKIEFGEPVLPSERTVAEVNRELYERIQKLLIKNASPEFLANKEILNYDE